MEHFYALDVIFLYVTPISCHALQIAKYRGSIKRMQRQVLLAALHGSSEEKRLHVEDAKQGRLAEGNPAKVAGGSWLVQDTLHPEDLEGRERRVCVLQISRLGWAHVFSSAPARSSSGRRLGASSQWRWWSATSWMSRRKAETSGDAPWPDDGQGYEGACERDTKARRWTGRPESIEYRIRCERRSPQSSILPEECALTPKVLIKGFPWALRFKRIMKTIVFFYEIFVLEVAVEMYL